MRDFNVRTMGMTAVTTVSFMSVDHNDLCWCNISPISKANCCSSKFHYCHYSLLSKCWKICFENFIVVAHVVRKVSLQWIRRFLSHMDLIHSFSSYFPKTDPVSSHLGVVPSDRFFLRGYAFHTSPIYATCLFNPKHPLLTLLQKNWHRMNFLNMQLSRATSFEPGTYEDRARLRPIRLQLSAEATVRPAILCLSEYRRTPIIRIN
jgi:hypothetical protein